MKFSVGTEYRFPTVVRHQGMVIVLALDEKREIYYRVLALDPAQPDDDKSWSDRKKLGFPDEIRPAGMSLVTVGLKTAERTADAPFQAVSDGKHVYLFRQSTDGTLYVDRFVFDPAPQKLNPAWEARFQRSRKRDLPASRKDTLGARDMESEPFFEPTTQLTVVKGLQDGRFCALLLPGRLPSQWRWQIFATNSEGEIDSFSIRRGEDGLFDMADVQRTCVKWADVGRRFQTGPAALLYMQQEQARDEYGRPQRVKRGARVMLAAPVGSSRYALELDGADDYVSLGNPASLQLEGAITLEAWVKVQATDGRRDVVAQGADGIYLRIQDGNYQIGTGSQCASCQVPQQDVDAWIHLAGAYDSEQGAWLLFRNGIQVAQETDPAGAMTVEEDWAIGRSFAGQINNVRLWKVARTQGEILLGMHRRLAGDEPGLVGDWPFDEGSGDTVYDRTSENHGQLHVGCFLALDGRDDYVELPNMNPDYANGFTVEAWVRYRSFQRWSRIIDLGNGAPEDNIVFANCGTTNDLVFQVYGDGAWSVITAPGVLETGIWMHLTATVDGDGNAALYKDGQRLVTGTVRVPDTLSRKENYIGRSNWAQDGHFDGGIQQVRVWNIARSQEEIQATMNESLTSDQSGLVGCWPLDEVAGDVVHDRASGHHDGQLRVGYALSLDGLDDHIALPAMNPDLANGLTVEAWVRYRSFQSWSRIIDFGNGAGEDNLLFANAGISNDLVFQVYRDRVASTITAQGALETGAWMHLAATVDRYGKAALYKDGQLLFTGTFTGTFHVPKTVSRTQSYIGRSNWAADGYFDGDMGDVRVWNVARTQDEIQQDMQGPPAGEQPGLVGYWLSDAGAGDTVRDRASGNDGRFCSGPEDSVEKKWGPGPDNPDDKWREGPEDPNDKWVVVPAIAILDFGVSREGTLALIGEKDRSEVSLGLSGAGSAATLPIPVLEKDVRKAAVPMPTIAVDKKGLTVSAGLLNFAHSGDTPFLLDGADGLIHLYFQGDYGQFLVAQHDTLTARAEYTLPLDGTGATDAGPRLQFTARRPGTQMGGYKIAIADGPDGNTCQVTIDNQNGSREVWQRVPRDLASFLAVLNGAATSDANDPLVREGDLVFYDYGSNVQREGVPDLTSADNPFFGSALFALGGDNLPDTGVPIAVGNVDAVEMAAPGLACAWIPEPQGKALQFDGADDYVALPHDKLAIAGDLAMEAWVNVVKGAGSSHPLRLINYCSEGARFALGLVKEGDDYKVFAASEDKAMQTADAQVSPEEWTHLAAVYNATNALKLDGQGYVDCGNDVTLDMAKAVTVEAWVTPERSERLQPEVILSKWGAAVEEQSWRLYIDTDGKPCFETRDQRRNVIGVKANLPLVADRPYHLAGAFDASPKEEMALAFDGKVDRVILGNPDALNFTGKITIAAWVKVQATDGLHNIVAHGHDFKTEVFLRIRKNEYEFGSWDSQGDHKTSYKVPPEDMDTWVHLAGVYDGANWILYRNGVQAKSTPNGTGAIPVKAGWAIGARDTTGEDKRFFEGQINNVRIWDRALSLGEIIEDMDKPARDVKGAVGNWAFDQADSLSGSVQDYAGNSKAGILEGAKSFVTLDKCSYRQKIWVDGDLKGWRWVSTDDGAWPGVLASRLLTPSDPEIEITGLGIDPQVKVGDYLLIQDEQVVIREEPRPKRANDDVLYYELAVDRAINGIAQEHGIGTKVYLLKRGANEVALTSARVNLGRSASDMGYFQGIVDDARLWDAGRRDCQILYYRDHPLPGAAEGLVGEWLFEEGRGKTAIDSKGSNHGRLVHPESDQIAQMWTPAARNARLTLYVNGRGVQTSEKEPGPAEYGGYGTDDQFAIGAMIAMDETPEQHMADCIDEVRIWSMVRSPEQIRDNMYRALSGTEEGLAGYWPLDEGTGTTIHDQTGNGQDGTVKERQWIDSTAPIGNEGPEVKNVYGGLEKLGFNRQIAGPPAAMEYGDMQWDDEGKLFGVMKRCYIFQDDALQQGDALQLVSGFKVGDLELNFIGQVQTAPTLIGYIEGAPPVPSENLTVNDPATDDYVGTSAIQLTEARETTQVYSASRDTGFDMSVEFKAGVHWKTGASAGLGVETEVFSSEGKVGLHAFFEHSMGYLSTASKTAGTSKTLTKSLTLGGGWEEACLNPEVGRRYLPNNMGYALVKSGTADLFALRLKRTGSLVAFQVLPNPDIPEDWNIIMFPLNPKYVKNGTLDGMVGLVADPDYPNAIVGERGSYFKPLEAYALKEQIEREAKQIEGYYATFDERAAKMGTGEDEDGLLSELPGGELGYDWETGRDKRSMANTYVWTADGGFYAEEEQFSSIWQQSLGSSYHFLGKGGVYADVKLAAPIGFFFEVDALFGGHINTTVTKSKEEKAAFGLHVDVQGEGFLNRWQGDPDKQQGRYLAEACPGKVDGYRFMTFYLAPKPQSFDRFFAEIVDPEWLNGQGKYAAEYGPNARALREARSKPNEVWRVLHRVTYVSRIPPRFESTPVEAVPKEVRRPANIEANIGLIREIERIKRLLPPSPEESHLVILGRAVDRLLFGDASGKAQGQSELERSVSWWDDRDEKKKREIRQDLITYLKAFYESDLVAPQIEGEEHRVTEGLQVLYTFEEGEGKTVGDVSGVGQPLNLAIEGKEGDVGWLAGGLALTRKAAVATPGPATKLIQAAKASNELTIEAWVKPANARQRAARIVTLSAKPRERNFALEQDGDHYQVYLRTRQTDDVGTGTALEAGKVATDSLSHLVYARDVSGRARFYLNGVEVGHREVAGDFSNWDDRYRFGLGNEISEDQPWQGEVHLVAIYNRALGPAEVAQNHRAGAGTTR